VVVEALEQLHSAIVQHEATHSGESDMTRHFLNARRRQSRDRGSKCRDTRDGKSGSAGLQRR